jgi:hypothetical protein
VSGRLVGLFACIVVVAGACATTGPTPIPVAIPSTVPATALPTAASRSASAANPSDATSGSASASASPGPGSAVRDDSLLSILPPDVENAPVTVEEASFDEAMRDPAFVEHVARAAFAVVTTPTDLASGLVAQLRPGLLDDTFLADWRETYNEGACAQAGGVATNAETELGGRTVYITTCGGGLTVYHAAIPERDVIVSLFSIGEGRFGEQLMRDLRP